MGINKLFFLTFTLLNFERGFCQSLTVNETLDYLNKIKTTGRNSFERISLDSEGYLSKILINYNYYNEKYNSVPRRDTTYITINVYDIDEIYLTEKELAPHQIEVTCKDQISCLRGGGGSEIVWDILDLYDARRFHKAIVYLISLATDLGYKRNDTNDPFARKPANVKIKSPKKVTSVGIESKIPLKEENGVYTLTVSLSGIISKFILDSGAGESNISSELEKKLLANGIIKQKDYLTNGLYRLADGSIQECRRVRIPKMTVGNKTVYNINVSISPLNSSNLMGQSFLRKTNKWTIDNEKKYLIIQ